MPPLLVGEPPSLGQSVASDLDGSGATVGAPNQPIAGSLLSDAISVEFFKIAEDCADYVPG
jgi:hypothetical protein